MSFPRYPEYKDNGADWLGVVPAHWDVVRARWLCEIKKRIVGELGFDVLSITQKGIRIKDTQSNDGQLSMDYSKYQLVEVGDFAMNHMDLLTGYVDISPVVGVTSPDYRVFSIRDPSVCHDRYLLYLFQNGYLNKVFFPFGQGSSQLGRWRLPTEQFNDFWFPVPSVDEQRAITTFLDRETAKIDALVAEQEKLIILLQEKRQAVISHAVTKGLDPTVPMKDSGVEWLGKVPAHWAIAAVNYRYEVLLGKMLDEKRITGLHLAPYLRNVDVQWDRINIEDIPQMDFNGDEFERYSLRTGDLLVCEGGEVGRAAIWRGDIAECYYQKALHRLRPRQPDQDVSRFQFYLLQMAAKLDVFTGGEGKSTIAHLTAEALRRYRFAYPPHDEQERIVFFLDSERAKLDTLVSEAQSAITLLQERRTALISAAVTGQIDVRHLAEVRV